ncbi:MAG: ABC transporter permease [Verrucomicrobia bacterium]|jgi:spermidine/putrescine transport system permease protein|nr:ABC transporter permease [Verrucomicrobiota bacterium]
MKRARLPLGLSAVGLYLFLYAPLAMVIVFSFNAARHGVAWQGFTTDWYRRLLSDELALSAAKNTLLLGGFSTAIATVLGTLLAFGLSRSGLPGQRWALRLLQLPVFIPDIVFAAAMLLFYSLARQWLGLFELGMSTMVMAHVTFQIPFVTIVVRARLAGLDPSLEEAARDLGANPWQAFRCVTLPLILPGVLAAAMLAFTLSLDDFVVSFFTSGPGSTTLPILIYSSVKRGVTPEINALATLIVLASLAATLSVVLLQRRRRA